MFLTSKKYNCFQLNLSNDNSIVYEMMVPRHLETLFFVATPGTDVNRIEFKHYHISKQGRRHSE